MRAWHVSGKQVSMAGCQQLLASTEGSPSQLLECQVTSHEAGREAEKAAL